MRHSLLPSPLRGRAEEVGNKKDGFGAHHHFYFSVSTSPRTNRRCMNTTTATGGNIASTAVAIPNCPSAPSSAVLTLFLLPVTIFSLPPSAVIKSAPQSYF